VTLLLDYAWAKPSPAAIKAAGYSGVMRYLSHDSTKNLSKAEATGLLAAGLSIGLVWETTASRAGAGFAAGAADVVAAEAQATALGYPLTAVLFYAVDYDAAPAAVAPYFAGVTSKAHRPVGVYGGIRVVDGVVAPWKWQACAWSAGRVSTSAHLYQRLHATVAHPLSGTDENVVLHPFPMWTNTPVHVDPVTVSRGGWVRPIIAVIKAVLTRKPARNIALTIAIQRAIHVTADGKWGNGTQTAANAVIRRDLSNVRALQGWVDTKVDGIWGTQSEAARIATIKRLQMAMGVAQDGDWGPITARAWANAVTANLNKF
jgi:hypothetical protein